MYLKKRGGEGTGAYVYTPYAVEGGGWGGHVDGVETRRDTFLLIPSRATLV